MEKKELRSLMVSVRRNEYAPIPMTGEELELIHVFLNWMRSRSFGRFEAVINEHKDNKSIDIVISDRDRYEL